MIKLDRMEDLALEILVKQIRETAQPLMITPRSLMRAFGYSRRSRHCVETINAFLADNGLETCPNYQDTWADALIQMRLTPETEHEVKNYARCNSKEDPVKRLNILDEAHRTPLCVQEKDTLVKAETMMRLHNYSQLPVLDEGGYLKGCITWESICYARSRGISSELVQDYMTQNYQIAWVETPLLDAYELVYKHEYIIVVDGETPSPIGIVTIADLSSKFIAWTGPYILTNEVEQFIRHLCDDKYPLAEVQERCKNYSLKDILKVLKWKRDDPEHAEEIEKIDKILQKSQKEIHCLDDLTFGQYKQLLNNETNWRALGLPNVDRKTFIDQIDAVRNIRNDVMHFNMDEEDSSDKIAILRETADFISRNMLDKNKSTK